MADPLQISSYTNINIVYYDIFYLEFCLQGRIGKSKTFVVIYKPYTIIVPNMNDISAINVGVTSHIDRF